MDGKGRRSGNDTEENQVKKKGGGRKAARNDSWMNKLERKAGLALSILILVCVFGGAAIGQMKCEKGFRNA